MKEIINVGNASHITVHMFDEMAIAMRGEKHLLLAEYDGQKLYDQHQAGLSVIQIDEGGTIISHITLWHLIDKWYELGTIWTHSCCRKRGMAEQLMRDILLRRTHIMLTTTNSAVYRLSNKVGMTQRSFHDLPEAVHNATCVCPPNKIRGCIDQKHCPLKNEECRCYVK